MKKLIVTIFAVLLSAYAQADNILPVEIVPQQDQPVNIFFKYVTAHERNGTVDISGRITSYNHHVLLPAGHVDIAVYSPDGKILNKTTTRYNSQRLSHRNQRKGGVRFSTYLGGDIPADAFVKVAFHQDKKPAAAEYKPQHSENIAR